MRLLMWNVFILLHAQTFNIRSVMVALIYYSEVILSMKN